MARRRKTGFVVVARLTGPIMRRLAHLRYTTPSRGVEVAEFRYQPTRWVRAQRFVVIRRPQPEEPSEQLTRFKLGRYHYQVLVTNLPLQPLNLWRFYNDRAGIELVVRQLKGDYALATSPVIISSPTKPTSTCFCSPTIWSIGCRVGGGALARLPPSAAQTARAGLPHAAFTKTQVLRDVRKGLTLQD
jgi:hypothetical protein